MAPAPESTDNVIPIGTYAGRGDLRRRAAKGVSDPAGSIDGLIPIGQFAAASRLSLKALRLYDQSGLLPARFVDPDSGYRYYAFEQLRSATLIGLLRRAGMPLAEIRSVLDDPAAVRLEEYGAVLAAELADRRRILDYVRLYLKEEHMFDVKTKQVEEQPYVSRSRRLRVDELSPFIRNTISDLVAEHEPNGSAFALFHGQVNETDDGPVEVCVPTAGGDKRLPGGEVAYTLASGPACAFPEIIGAYDAVAGWAKANGRDLVGPPREIYHAEKEWEIAWLLD
jgi:DNA-binding transcriptional MerR regulator